MVQLINNKKQTIMNHTSPSILSNQNNSNQSSNPWLDNFSKDFVIFLENPLTPLYELEAMAKLVVNKLKVRGGKLPDISSSPHAKKNDDTSKKNVLHSLCVRIEVSTD
jgi:hypothetical protein